MFAPMNIFELAAEAAIEGVVLLKNINETLPLWTLPSLKTLQ
jgi:hypothetical protein